MELNSFCHYLTLRHSFVHLASQISLANIDTHSFIQFTHVEPSRVVYIFRLCCISARVRHVNESHSCMGHIHSQRVNEIKITRKQMVYMYFYTVDIDIPAICVAVRVCIIHVFFRFTFTCNPFKIDFADTKKISTQIEWIHWRNCKFHTKHMVFFFSSNFLWFSTTRLLHVYLSQTHNINWSDARVFLLINKRRRYLTTYLDYIVCWVRWKCFK